MMLIPTYLAPSTIEGLGVHTRVAIRKGEPVWRMDPRFDRLIPVEDFEAAPEEMRVFLDRYAYPCMTDPSFLVLDVDDGRYMNHSDAPNCDFRDTDVGYALRDIAVGEELTCDYREFLTGDLAHQGPRNLVLVAQAA
jgi:SET domain-containing protein